jgi:hypothetical protein
LLSDVLEHRIIPNVKMYSHPFTMTSISFFLNLIRPQQQQQLTNITSKGMENENAHEQRNYYYWCLLRTQYITSHSTAEFWHTGPTAIDLMVQLFHRVVIRQLVDDHLPNASTNTILVVLMLPIRDQIIRFIHRILLYVQNDRHWWEKERASDKMTLSGSKRKDAKRTKPISFTTVLSKNLELYKSAAASILTITSNENCLQYFLPDSDIRTMLRLQMDELMEDQLEKMQN